MRFKCGCCGAEVKKEPKVPKGFVGWAYCCDDCIMEWLESGEEIPPLDSESWIRRETRPEVGEICDIRVRKPFDEEIGDEFYMQLKSPRDYYTDEMTDEVIACGGIIKCRFESVVSRDDYIAWIKVRVLEVFMNDELYKAFDEYEREEPLVSDFERLNYDTGKWRGLLLWDGGGDIGEYCDIYTDSDGREHLVLQGFWDYHNEYVYFGNIVSNNREQTNDSKDNR
ncbi:hypothetical protein [Ruminococcus albus]|uniref:Uncharacterized protein n=1 Tax=Ruminococcus albus TaxID=1264 RepID=A0A1I1GG74_RUMAL|nr:hypothetical protein [Ruminococcus albus]SFC08848.1 hypothetical protein SAMN02910406_01115 [Ruminococcus albus]